MIIHRNEIAVPGGERAETEWLEPETVEERWLVLKRNARLGWDMTAKRLADLFEECVPWAAPLWNDRVHGPRWRETHGESWRDVCDDGEFDGAYWRSMSEKFRREATLAFSESRTLKTHSPSAGEVREAKARFERVHAEVEADRRRRNE